MTVARVFAVLSVALTTVLFSASNAMAATPVTWEDPDADPTIAMLTYVVGAPIALFLVVVALAAAVNLKAKHYSPEIPNAELDVIEH